MDKNSFWQQRRHKTPCLAILTAVPEAGSSDALDRT